MARFDDMMALSQLNQELRERNKDLDAFAHTVAHDLQDPLSIVIGYAELLNLMWDIPPNYKSYTDSIIRMGHKMTTIIRELTLLSRIHQLDVEMESLNMADIVTEAQQRLVHSHLVEHSQAEIILPPSWPTVWGHVGWVEEIWVNYLSNAIKYGGQPPRVELGATVLPDGKMAHFWVRDNGQGLTTEQQTQLFKPFTRLHSGTVNGTGLGLSIVNRIIEKLGGQVTLESEVGRGSQFGFTLPLTRKAPPQAVEFTTTFIR
jgi:signal transduction histidine kinase